MAPSQNQEINDWFVKIFKNSKIQNGGWYEGFKKKRSNVKALHKSEPLWVTYVGNLWEPDLTWT